MAKHKKKRVIHKARISHLSLCPRGANDIQTLYKSDDGDDISLSTITVGKMNEQGELLAVVYAPDMVDSQGDTASAKVIKDFAYDFSRDGAGIDVRHNEETLPPEDAYIAESFIIQKGDPRFTDAKDYEGNAVNVTGGWGVVLKIDNEDLRKQYREEGWGGISMGGLMQVSDVSDTSGVLKMLKELLSSIGKTKINKNMENNDMPLSTEDKKEVAELVAKTMTDHNEKVKKEADEEAKKEADKSPKGMGLIAPVLKDNPTDEDIANHKKNLNIFELSKCVDTNDLDSVDKFQKLKQSIMDGKEVDVSKDDKSRPFDAFATNQGGGAINNAHKSVNDEQQIENDMFKDMNKEKEAAAKQ